MDPGQVLIFDTTLRDGEQSPGISLNASEKLEIAQQLARQNILGPRGLVPVFPVRRQPPIHAHPIRQQVSPSKTFHTDERVAERARRPLLTLEHIGLTCLRYRRRHQHTLRQQQPDPRARPCKTTAHRRPPWQQPCDESARRRPIQKLRHASLHGIHSQLSTTPPASPY